VVLHQNTLGPLEVNMKLVLHFVLFYFETTILNFYVAIKLV
jgi:hypothetical protein